MKTSDRALSSRPSCRGSSPATASPPSGAARSTARCARSARTPRTSLPPRSGTPRTRFAGGRPPSRPARVVPQHRGGLRRRHRAHLPELPRAQVGVDRGPRGTPRAERRDDAVDVGCGESGRRVAAASVAGGARRDGRDEAARRAADWTGGEIERQLASTERQARPAPAPRRATARGAVAWSVVADVTYDIARASKRAGGWARAPRSRALQLACVGRKIRCAPAKILAIRHRAQKARRAIFSFLELVASRRRH